MASVDRKYTTLIALAPDPIFLFDSASGTIHEASETALETVGYDRDELLGMDVRALHPADEADAYQTLLERTLAEETIRTPELPNGSQIQLLTADGKRIPIEMHARTVSMGDETWIYTVARDISARKRHEERLETQRNRLEVLNQVLRHDLRNDFQVVAANAELLEEHTDADGQDYLETIRERAENATQITRTAGEIAELIRNPAPDRESVSLPAVLRAQRDHVAETTENATIDFATEPPRVDVLATDMLGSVFRNLFTNAIQHNDSESPTVTVTAELQGETVAVRVADDGPGIPDDRKETLFQKGEKGLESDGSGLGLYLARTLVHSYGGDIGVKDNDPRGSIFTVHLPVADGSIPPDG